MAARYLIIASRFNDLITKSLHSGAMEAFANANVGSQDVETLWVPGSFEMGTVAAKAANSGSFAAIVCIGAVIRGETPHFEYVSSQVAASLQRIGVETGVPVIFGVLTTDNTEQALNRAGIKGGNKGADAANAAMQMVKTMAKLSEITRR